MCVSLVETFFELYCMIGELKQCTLMMSRTAFAAPSFSPFRRKAPVRARCAARFCRPRAALHPNSPPARVPGDAGRIPERAPAAQADVEKDTDEAFSWSEQWYAVALEDDIADGTPYAFTLFGTDYALFRDAPGHYSVLLDRCPHRLAPLSLGRVVKGEDGCAELECRYHGWRFGASGACTQIPQIGDAAIPPAARVRAFPAAAARGFVFVWLGDPAGAAAAPLPFPDFLDDAADGVRGAFPTSHVLLPYSYEALVENVFDPAHVQFAHHGISFMARDQPVGDNFAYKMSSTTRRHGTIASTFGDTAVQFRAPGLVTYTRTLPDGRLEAMMFHASPVARRRSRLMLTVVIGGMPAATLRRALSMPKWLYHIGALNTLDGDTPLLCGVDRALGANANWRRMFGPPAGQTDRAPHALRAWLDAHRDAMPWAGADDAVPRTETLSRREMLDRVRNHAQHCRACTGAIRGFERAKRVAAALGALAVMGVVSAAFAAALVGAGVVPTKAWRALLGVAVAMAAVALGCVLVERKCDSFLEKLTYTEYATKVYLTA